MSRRALLGQAELISFSKAHFHQSDPRFDGHFPALRSLEKRPIRPKAFISSPCTYKLMRVSAFFLLAVFKYEEREREKKGKRTSYKYETLHEITTKVRSENKKNLPCLDVRHILRKRQEREREAEK